jgi:hypothetical protein
MTIAVKHKNLLTSASHFRYRRSGGRCRRSETSAMLFAAGSLWWWCPKHSVERVVRTLSPNAAAAHVFGRWSVHSVSEHIHPWLRPHSPKQSSPQHRIRSPCFYVDISHCVHTTDVLFVVLRVSYINLDIRIYEFKFCFESVSTFLVSFELSLF